MYQKKADNSDVRTKEDAEDLIKEQEEAKTNRSRNGDSTEITGSNHVIDIVVMLSWADYFQDRY